MSFISTIKDYRDGKLARELDESLTELVSEIEEHGKGGSLTLTLALKPNGEAAITAPEFVELSETGSVDLLMPDLNLCGGFVEGMRVADYAHLAGLRVSPHVWGGAVGLVAAMHYVAAMPVHPHVDADMVPTYVEYDVSDNPIADALLTETPAPVDGRLAMPAGPGLGIEIDPDALKRLRLD